MWKQATSLFLFDNSMVGVGGIWTLDVSIGNVRKCQLSYKALGSSLLLLPFLVILYFCCASLNCRKPDSFHIFKGWNLGSQNATRRLHHCPVSSANLSLQLDYWCYFSTTVPVFGTSLRNFFYNNPWTTRSNAVCSHI